MEKKNITSKNFTRVRNAIERELTQAISIFDYGKNKQYVVKHNNVGNIVVYSELFSMISGACMGVVLEVVEKWMKKYYGLDWCMMVNSVEKSTIDGDVYSLKVPMFELTFGVK